MISHEDAIAAHVRAAELRRVADVATVAAARKSGSVFSAAFAEAKHREAVAAVRSATAQSVWVSWTMKARP